MKKTSLLLCRIKLFTIIITGVIVTMNSTIIIAAEKPADADNFYQSDKVVIEKVTFPTQYKLKITGNLMYPREMSPETPYPAIIVSHPMGAVKEQSANLYATKMAERGFVTLAIDLPFWGESEGEVRNAVSPDLYAEAFSAAADFLRTLDSVDKEKIGVIGICGSGGFAISAAKIDPRLKAIATVSMYDMGQAVRNGLGNTVTLSQRQALAAEAANQRDIEFAGGKIAYTSGTVQKIDENSTPIEVEFFEYYRTPRGEVTPAGAAKETTTHPTLATFVKFMNFDPFEDLELIAPRPLLFITGEKAHSREFSEDAAKRTPGPHELYIVPNAGHVDLYDRVNLIPFDKLENFFRENLK